MNYYLIHLQFLGFRFHGWQLQKDVKTVQYMLNRTLVTVLGHENFKTLGASRTDSMVSANHHLCQLATEEELDLNEFVEKMNFNLPQDIRILKLENKEKKFNLLNSKKIKTYHYYFTFGAKTHPFIAPLVTNIIDDLDLEKMQKAAELFIGEHNFRQYCYRGNENKIYIRKVFESKIFETNDFQGTFFPEKIYCFKVSGNGFMRNQIRLMMGTLFQLGIGKITIDQIQKTLEKENTETRPIGFIAPASGLVLIENKFSE